MKLSRAEAVARLRADILALAQDSRPDILFSDERRKGSFWYREHEYMRQHDRFMEVLRRHGQKGTVNVELRNNDGRVLARTRELFRPKAVGSNAGNYENRVGRWGLSLLMGGTRGFEIEGGPGRWTIVLGGTGATSGDKTVADLLNVGEVLAASRRTAT